MGNGISRQADRRPIVMKNYSDIMALVIVVAAAAVALLNLARRLSKKKYIPSCDCSSCPLKSSCTDNRDNTNVR